jgi:hypothetical protein
VSDSPIGVIYSRLPINGHFKVVPQDESHREMRPFVDHYDSRETAAEAAVRPDAVASESISSDDNGSIVRI